ncbi:hypothetical protein M378DRAFT_166979 [Amanita muscaria Koide BX008]|uniref:Secreted protein n=1 Tax=Amanita muscaria (strain Koide BX008) TaxID=946122 RepID=A0A0C2WII0_AMAMK|nr:hypothetical protein M378DRAFT_166979 [Amanita muscaria Koide BX008]
MSRIRHYTLVHHVLSVFLRALFLLKHVPPRPDITTIILVRTRRFRCPIKPISCLFDLAFLPEQSRDGTS